MSNLRTLIVVLLGGVLLAASAHEAVFAQDSPDTAVEQEQTSAQRAAGGEAQKEEQAADEASAQPAEDDDGESGGIVIEGVARQRAVIELPGLGKDAADEAVVPGADAPQGLVIERGSAGVGAASSRGIRLNFERNGSSVLVPAKVGRFDVYFVLDTGATYTTLTSEIARQARITPDASAPTTLMQTAGGVRQAQFGLMTTLQLGDTTLRQVSFTVCDACGFGTYRARPIVGLLGLNVLARFQMNMDSAAGVVELTPHRDFQNQSADMRPWVSAQLMPYQMRVESRSRLRMIAQIRNLAEVPARDVVIEFRCNLLDGSVERVRTRPASVGAKTVADTELAQSVSACQGWQAELVEGYWR